MEASALLLAMSDDWITWVVGGAVVGVGVGVLLARRTKQDAEQPLQSTEAVGDWVKNPNATARKIDDVGPALYTHAKTLISGGVGLLSKRPELFLPDL